MFEKIFTIDFVDPTKSTISLGSSSINGPSSSYRSTDLDLLGMGHTLWGEAILEDLIHLLENFACPEDIHDITSVNVPSQAITFVGNLLKSFPAGDVFTITGSDTNNGSWTVQSSSYDSGLDKTTVIVTGGLSLSSTLGIAGHPGYPHRSLKFSPLTPVEGQVWYNKTQGQTFVFSSTSGSPATVWKRVNNVSVGTVEPTNPSEGDLWWETNSYPTNSPQYGRNLQIYMGGSWIRVVEDYLPRDGSKVMAGDLDMDSHKIVNVGSPIAATDALNLGAADNRFVNVTGDTMSGPLDMSGNVITGVGSPVAASDAVNLDFAENRYVNVTGDTMTGLLTINNTLVVTTGITSNGVIELGEPGGSDSIVRFYDNDSITWRDLRWNNTTNVFEVENDNGAYGVIWNSANDGAGSGLDADTVDGLHAADLISNYSSPAFGNRLTLTGPNPNLGLVGSPMTYAIEQYGDAVAAIDAGNYDYFGTGVSITDDGQFLIVGASEWDGSSISNQGVVYTYTRAGEYWRYLSKTTAFDAAANDSYGHSVAVSPDGSMLVVGAYRWEGSNTDQGGVYTYLWNGSAWVIQGGVLSASDAVAGDQFGSSVSLSYSGNVLVVGAHQRNGGQGGVYVYDWNGSTWVQRGSVLLPSAGGTLHDSFGTSVSISHDETLLAVGAEGWGSPANGAVYLFDWNGSSWIQHSTILTDADLINPAPHNFGSGIGLSPDKLTLAVGARNGYSVSGGVQSGTVTLYDWDSLFATWNQRGDSFTPSSLATGSGYSFGYSVSLVSKDLLAVSATGVSTSAGRVYFFNTSREVNVEGKDHDLTITSGPTTPLRLDSSTGIGYVYDLPIITKKVTPGTTSTLATKSNYISSTYGGWLLNFNVLFTGKATVSAYTYNTAGWSSCTAATIYINGIATPYGFNNYGQSYDIPFKDGDHIQVYGTTCHSSGVGISLTIKSGTVFVTSYTT